MKLNARNLLVVTAVVAAWFSQGSVMAAEAVVENAAAELKKEAIFDSVALERRTAKIMKDVPRRLARKNKFARTEATAQWQQAWASGASGAVTEGGTTTTLARFDQPQEALAHFLGKRLAAGQSAVGAADYTNALAQIERMPVYSTQQGAMVSAAARASIQRAGPAAAANIGLAGSWQALGPGNIGGRTRALLIHPTTPQVMWAGGVAGGIWKSTNGGNTWVPKADLLVNIAVNSMLVDPRNTNTLYAGTGEGFFNGDGIRGAGILKSTDGGETWSQLASTANSDFFYVQKIVMSKGSSQRLYAATRTGVFRSLDGGGSWTKVLDGTAVNGCMDLAIQTDRALANVFAACGTFAQATIYRALDTGAATQTWNAVHAPTGMGRTSLAIAPSNQNVVYAMSASASTNALLAVYRSTTSGTAGSWTTRVDATSPTRLNRALLNNPVFYFLGDCGFGGANNTTLSQGWYDNALAVDPANSDIVWAGGIDLFRSDDGGANWGQASHWWFDEGVDPAYNHADQHTVVFHPQYNGTTNKIMFTGNDGGVHMTADARAPVSFSPDPISSSSPVCGNVSPTALSWTSKNNGYQVTQFYDGAVFPSGDDFIGGTQDNGTLLGSIAGGNTWSRYFGGDGGYVAVNPDDTNMVWFENTARSFKRTSDGNGNNFVDFISGITEPSGNFIFIAPMVQDPSNAARMWVGGARMWRTDVATNAVLPASIWTQASTFISGARVSAIAVSPLNSNRVYAGMQAVGGATAATISGQVFTSGAAGTATSATVWSGSKPRPGINNVSWITADPVAAGTVYATISTFNDGTGSGHVFRSTDFGATWTNIDGSGATGIPDVPALTIAIDPQNNQRLYVGTDLGVFVSIDGGANWARENTGFANVSVEALKIKNTAPRYIYAFTHGRSVFRAPLDGAAPAAAPQGAVTR